MIIINILRPFTSVSFNHPNTDFHSNTARTICQKLSSPSPEREEDVAQPGNQQY